MNFRKNECFYFFTLPIFISLILLYIIMFFCLQKLILLCLLSIFAISGVIFYTSIRSERIEINTENIICRKKKTTLWEFNWTDIQEIHVGSRNRFLSAELVFKTKDKEEKKRIESIDPWFEYGRSAKKALKQYCPCPIILTVQTKPFQKLTGQGTVSVKTEKSDQPEDGSMIE